MRHIYPKLMSCHNKFQIGTLRQIKPKLASVKYTVQILTWKHRWHAIRLALDLTRKFRTNSS